MFQARTIMYVPVAIFVGDESAKIVEQVPTRGHLLQQAHCAEVWTY